MENEKERCEQDSFSGFIFNKPQRFKESLRGWVNHFHNIGCKFVVLQQGVTGQYVIFKGSQDTREDMDRSVPLSKVLNNGYRMVEYLDMTDEVRNHKHDTMA